MISKRTVAVGVCLSVVMGLVAAPAFAGRYQPTPEGPNRWEYQREELYPEETQEAEAMETPAAEENLIDSAYNTVAGAAYVTGKTITGTANAAGKTVLDTADAGGKALVGTAEAGGRMLGGAADASGKALVGTAEAGGRTLSGAADAVTGTAGAAYRTVVGGEESAQERIEEVAIEQPKEKGLFKASWDAIAGTAGAIGRTFGAVYASVFPVKEPEAEIEEAEPVEPQARRHRFVPRYHGMVARRVAY